MLYLDILNVTKTKEPSLFTNLDSYTVILGVFAIISAGISLSTSIVESKDKRKKIWGLFARDIKTISTYATFILAILTIVVQDKHDSDDKLEATNKEIKQATIQRENLNTTLISIGKTLQAQKETLDSTDTILNRQRWELKNQVIMLGKEEVALKNYSDIILKEGLISSSVQSSIGLLNTSLNNEGKSLAVLNSTAQGMQALKYPLSNSFGLVFKVRFYTKGESEIWSDKGNMTGILIPKMADLRNIIAEKVKKLSFDAMQWYFAFFNDMTLTCVDHQFLINYNIDNQVGKIQFEPIPGQKKFPSINIPFNVFYNEKEHYFETEGDMACGTIKLNLGEISSFDALINKSDLYIRLKYAGDKDFELPCNRSNKQPVSIDHIIISQVETIKYGNSTQYSIVLDKNNINPTTDLKEIKTIWDEDVDAKDLWRYCFIKIPLKQTSVAAPL